jgi:hypothetical protein
MKSTMTMLTTCIITLGMLLLDQVELHTHLTKAPFLRGKLSIQEEAGTGFEVK